MTVCFAPMQGAPQLPTEQPQFADAMEQVRLAFTASSSYQACSSCFC